MAFPGFTERDYEIFDIPDFQGRIAPLRAELLPKLKLLGDDLAPLLSDAVGHPLYPRAAQHMRRRVNPPPETWVAFARDKRGYKRWAHFRVAVSGEGVRLTLFVEDDADDKPEFALNISRNPKALLTAIGPDAPLRWYTFGSNGGLAHGDLSQTKLRDRARDLRRVKQRKFQAGVQIAQRGETVPSPEELQERIMQALPTLLPLYRCAAPEAVRL